MKKNKGFAIFLRGLIKRRKTLPSRLAKQIGVNHTTFHRWLYSKDVPKIRTCVKLSEISGIPLEEILAAAGHINVSKRPPSEWPEIREYARLKYPDELDEDVILMLEKVIELRGNKKSSGREVTD